MRPLSDSVDLGREQLRVFAHKGHFPGFRLYRWRIYKIEGIAQIRKLAIALLKRVHANIDRKESLHQLRRVLALLGYRETPHESIDISGMTNEQIRIALDIVARCRAITRPSAAATRRGRPTHGNDRVMRETWISWVGASELALRRLYRILSTAQSDGLLSTRRTPRQRRAIVSTDIIMPTAIMLVFLEISKVTKVRRTKMVKITLVKKSTFLLTRDCSLIQRITKAIRIPK